MVKTVRVLIDGEIVADSSAEAMLVLAQRLTAMAEFMSDPPEGAPDAWQPQEPDPEGRFLGHIEFRILQGQGDG